MDALTLGFGTTFADVATRDGLVRLDKQFLYQLADADPGLHQRLLAARAAPDALDAKAEGELVVSLGPVLEEFVATLFGIEADEIIHQFIQAMTASLSYKAMMRAVPVHPTVAELIPTLLSGLKPLEDA